MVRGGRKYASNSPKIRFHPNTKLPTNTTDKSEKRLDKKEKHLNVPYILLDPTAGQRRRSAA
jgi:hypothetical protein